MRNNLRTQRCRSQQQASSSCSSLPSAPWLGQLPARRARWAGRP